MAGTLSLRDVIKQGLGQIHASQSGKFANIEFTQEQIDGIINMIPAEMKLSDVGKLAGGLGALGSLTGMFGGKGGNAQNDNKDEEKAEEVAV